MTIVEVSDIFTQTRFRESCSEFQLRGGSQRNRFQELYRKSKKFLHYLKGVEKILEALLP
jgi:hypothetical protein